MTHNAISKCPGDGKQSYSGLPRSGSAMEVAIQYTSSRQVVGEAIASLPVVEATMHYDQVLPIAVTIVV